MNKKEIIGKIFVHCVLLVIVIIWIMPSFGLFISSLRDKDQLATSGWWNALKTSNINEIVRLKDKDYQFEQDGNYIIEGKIFESSLSKKIISFGISSKNPQQYKPGEQVELKNGSFLEVSENGNYKILKDTKFEKKKGQRVFIKVQTPPRFTLENYREVLFFAGVGQSFLNSLTVAIPSTIIPLIIASFAAYALSWMQFWGRNFIFAATVCLLVVPLQMSLIPLLTMYNNMGSILGVEGKSYPGIWMAHTGFGMPLKIYLLRNFIKSLPREMIEAARVDGANHFQIFKKIILPLSIPAFASIGILQFLWVWNDLLVALVFLDKTPSEIVLTSKLREMLGSYGDNWEILTASAFVSMLIPLAVFLSLQKYFIRGLIAGSVKG
tara:strand:- start:1178 stop:2320 length:1143 start_codon:yes stop_codon:yes gene_type:complete